jgi:hypothetical protein
MATSSEPPPAQANQKSLTREMSQVPVARGATGATETVTAPLTALVVTAIMELQSELEVNRSTVRGRFTRLDAEHLDVVEIRHDAWIGESRPRKTSRSVRPDARQFPVKRMVVSSQVTVPAATMLAMSHPLRRFMESCCAPAVVQRAQREFEFSALTAAMAAARLVGTSGRSGVKMGMVGSFFN